MEKNESILASIQFGEKLILDDGIDEWIFDKPLQRRITCKDKEFFVLAENQSNQFLSIPIENISKSDSAFFIIDENEYLFHAFSLSELINKKKLFIQLANTKTEGVLFFKNMLEEYSNCIGSQFWITSELYTSQYDDNYSEEKNIEAHKIFEKLANGGDPRACEKVASYFYYETEEKDEVIKWRFAAIDNGAVGQLRELVDFIVDDYPEKISLAFECIKKMHHLNENVAWAFWKEGKIYLTGIGVEKDVAKAFKLIAKSANLGLDTAKADLAFCYYKGLGVFKDLKKVRSLLVEANDENLFEHEIRLIDEELAQSGH